MNFIVHCASVALLVAFSDSAAIKSQCRRILPQADIDWTKLQGTWYHLMYLPASRTFASCRTMELSCANPGKKVLKIGFSNIGYGVGSSTYQQSTLRFRWTEEPGLIHQVFKNGFKKKMTGSKTPVILTDYSISRTLASTDYTKFMILLQCKKDDHIASISLRDTDISQDLMDHLRSKMSVYGFPIDDIKLSNATCS